MSLLKLFNVWDSFKEDGIVCHIFAPRERVFSISYAVVFGFGAKNLSGVSLKGIDMVKSWPGPGQKYNLLYSTA